MIELKAAGSRIAPADVQRARGYVDAQLAVALPHPSHQRGHHSTPSSDDYHRKRIVTGVLRQRKSAMEPACAQQCLQNPAAGDGGEQVPVTLAERGSCNGGALWQEDSLATARSG